MRSTIIAILFLLSLSVPARAEEWIKIYQDGEPVYYAVGYDVEFVRPTDDEIDTANTALLDTVLGYGPWRADAGYGATEYNDTVDAAEHYGRRRGGAFAHKVAIRDYLSPGDWRGLFGDSYDPGATYIEADKSGPHWSFDGAGFSRWGYVYSLDDQGELVRSERRRRQGEITWRRGSMDGGVWRLTGIHYEMNVDLDARQAADVKFRQAGASFRQVENGYQLEGGVYYGSYTSDQLNLNNEYAGGELSAARQLSGDAVVSAEVDYRHTDAGLQDGSVERLRGGGQLSWDICTDATLITSARTCLTDNSVSVGSVVDGYQEYNGLLTYHPEPGVWVSAGFRRRETDLSRLTLEDPATVAAATTVPWPDFNVLDALRVDANSASDRIELRGRVRLKRSLFLSGYYADEQFDELPDAPVYGGASLVSSYFCDRREQGDMRLRWDLGGGANVQLSGMNQTHTNNDRDSEYTLRRYAAGYSGPLGGKWRWTAGVSRHETLVKLGLDPAEESASWNYDVSVASYGSFADYRLSWAHQRTDTAPGGDYHGLGLELTLADWPVSINAWYRKRTESLNGFGDYEDSGVTCAYHFELR